MNYTDLPSLNDYWMLIVILVIWECVWKGIAMWKAARSDDKPWFVILLVINSFGILPIIYIYLFAKTPKTRKKH